MVKNTHLKYTCLVIAVCLAGFSRTDTASGQAVIGARSVGLGSVTTALPENPWGVFGNPALMPRDQTVLSAFGFRYAGFSEISDMAVSVSTPFFHGTTAFGVHRYGFDLFNENRIRIGYSRQIDRFAFGLILNYNHINQGGGYGSAGAFGVDAGLSATLVDGLWFGAKTTNLNQPAYGKSDEDLPRELAIGLSYKLSEICFFSLEGVKDVRFPVSIRSGLEIQAVKEFTGRIGITTQPVTWSAGFGLQMSTWQINIAVQRHEFLGWSPAMDMGVSIGSVLSP